jgi:hypothetical protein
VRAAVWRETVARAEKNNLLFGYRVGKLPL